MRISYTAPRGGPEDAKEGVKGDALWIVFRDDLREHYDESEEIAEGVVAHYDQEGNIISMEVYEDASGKVDLTKLDISGLDFSAKEVHFA